MKHLKILSPALAGLAGAALVMVSALAISWRVPNLASGAPLAWATNAGPHESVWRVDAESIYCVAGFWGRHASLSSLSRIDRRTGERRWTRLTKSFGGPAYSESCHVFTEERCFLSPSWWDWNAKKSTGTKIVSVMLDDGRTEWEVPVAETLGDITLSEGVLYTVSHRGMLVAYDSRDGSELWRLDLGPFDPQANFGTVRRAGNALVVSCHLSQDYTNRSHSKSNLIDLRTRKRVLQTERGSIFGTQLFTWPSSGLACYDLETLSPIPSIPPSALTIYEMEARRGLEPLLVGRDYPYEWRGPLKLVDPHRFSAVEVTLPITSELNYVSDRDAYFSDYRHLLAIDRGSGRTRWSSALKAPRNMMVSDTLVAVMAGQRHLHVLDVRTGEPLWDWRISEELGYPYCDGNTIFIRDGRKLLCFESSPPPHAGAAGK